MAKINTIFSLTDNVTSPLNRINNLLNRTCGGFSSLQKHIITASSAVTLLSAGFRVLQQTTSFLSTFVKDAMEYESLFADVMVAMGNDAKLAQEEFEKLKDFASKTPFDLPGVVRASTMLRTAGIEADKVIPTIKMLGDVARGNNDYFNRMALNFMQIQSAGVASARDLKEFAYMGVPITNVLEDMGVTGVATAKDVENAFKIMTSAGGQFYNSMGLNAKTLNGAMSNMRDSFQQFSASIGDSLLPSVKEITRAMSELLNEVKNSEFFKGRFLQPLQEKMDWLKNNLDSIIATMIRLATVATVVGTTMAIAWAVANWPITLVVAGIVTIIRMMFNLTQQANETSKSVTGSFNQIGQSLSALTSFVGTIGSTIGGLFNIIYNAFVLVYNAINLVIETIINIPNLILHPIQSIKATFLNMIIELLEICSTFSSVIDFVFGSELSQSLNQTIDNLRAKKEEVAPDWKSGSYLSMKDVDWIASGGIEGYENGKWIGGLLDKYLTFQPYEYQDTSTTDDFKYDSSGALIVSDKNTISLADDFRELLSKQATERFNLQFSSVTPSVNVGDIIVNNNADYDKILEEIVNGAEMAQSSSLRS